METLCGAEGVVVERGHQRASEGPGGVLFLDLVMVPLLRSLCDNSLGCRCTITVLLYVSITFLKSLDLS